MTLLKRLKARFPNDAIEFAIENGNVVVTFKHIEGSPNERYGTADISVPLFTSESVEDKIFYDFSRYVENFIGN